MFRMHYVYKEGTRPSQVFPWCERELADAGNSDGQCGNIHASSSLLDVTCSYCLWEYTKTHDDVTYYEPVIVHWGVHPEFSRDGKGTFLGLVTKCRHFLLEGEHLYASRKKSEVTCVTCVPCKTELER